MFFQKKLKIWGIQIYRDQETNMWILNWKKIELKNKPVAWIEGIEYSWRKRLGFVRRKRDSLGILEETVRLFFILISVWCFGFQFLISWYLSPSPFLVSQVFSGSIASPLNCILTGCFFYKVLRFFIFYFLFIFNDKRVAVWKCTSLNTPYGILNLNSIRVIFLDRLFS